MTDTGQPADVFGGFWFRVGAILLDGILLMLITLPIDGYYASTGLPTGRVDYLMSWILPSLATILFWIYKAATPGKMAFNLRIADAATGQPASTAQLVGRYFALILSALPAGLGFFWAAWDRRKQTFHDKLAGTVVLRRVAAPATPQLPLEP